MKKKDFKIIVVHPDDLQTLIIDSVNACLKFRGAIFDQWEIKELKEWYSNNIDKLTEYNSDRNLDMDKTPSILIRLFDGDIS